MNTPHFKRTIDIQGVVQGVGFRPTVFRLATAGGLAGSVQNRSGSVRIVLEGTLAQLDTFQRDLPAQLPPNARLDSVTCLSETPVATADAAHGFTILDSEGSEHRRVVIPADLAICSECERELFDPKNRRHGYPFTTCTACGPRYTVVNTMPYDRARTTMVRFPLCAACQAEYENPHDRRFHAESIACPTCGPQLTLEHSSGTRVDGDPLPCTRRELTRGAIVAVRGLGGYLLAVDAFNTHALQTLRTRKRRPHKPFAVMARNLDIIRRYCIVPPEAERLLTSAESPIVILDVRTDVIASGQLPLELLTPDAATLGMMLPTTPLHHLLATPLVTDATPPLDLLVMTSGNHGGEPICIANDEARGRLKGIADFILSHTREINLRNDDSVCVLQRGHPQVWRRARGYAPNPVILKQPLRCRVLAMGAGMKNTVAFGFENHVVLSPHIGDLDTPEALDGYEQVVRCLPEFLQLQPQAVAVDLHPDMHATRCGQKLAAAHGLPVIPIQHHHAHAVGCLAEYGDETGLALVFDGTGLGTDGTIWGAELLEVSPDGFTRRATFAGAPLPGGDAAIREPARQLVARWIQAGIEISDEWRHALGVTDEQIAAWRHQCRQGINAPITHAAGRVFDAFAVALGAAPDVMTYEGQPAIRLESLARRHQGGAVPELPFTTQERDGRLTIDWSPAFALLEDRSLLAGRESAWALGVHHSIARAAIDMLDFATHHTSVRVVALSGGVFMNRILNDLLVPQLERQGLTVRVHRQVPPNDGGIAFGQAVIAGR